MQISLNRGFLWLKWFQRCSKKTVVVNIEKAKFCCLELNYYVLCCPVLKPQMTGLARFPGEAIENPSFKHWPIEPPSVLPGAVALAVPNS